MAGLAWVLQPFAGGDRIPGVTRRHLPGVRAAARAARLDGVAGLPGDVRAPLVRTPLVWTGSRAHRRRPRKAATTAPTMDTAAIAIDRYIAGSSAVQTIGSGGNP